MPGILATVLVGWVERSKTQQSIQSKSYTTYN